MKSRDHEKSHFPPGGILPFAGLLCQKGVSFSMNKIPPSVSKMWHSDFAGGQISQIAPKGGHETKVPNVPIQDDVLETFNRRTRLSKLWAYLAKNDFGASTSPVNFLKQEFCAHPRTVNRYRYATPALKAMLYTVIGSWSAPRNTPKTPFKFDSSPLTPHRHTHTSTQSGGPQNA